MIVVSLAIYRLKLRSDRLRLTSLAEYEMRRSLKESAKNEQIKLETRFNIEKNFTDIKKPNKYICCYLNKGQLAEFNRGITGAQSYTDTSPYEVSDYSLTR